MCLHVSRWSHKRGWLRFVGTPPRGNRGWGQTGCWDLHGNRSVRTGHWQHKAPVWSGMSLTPVVACFYISLLNIGELNRQWWWWRHLSLTWNKSCGFSVTTSSEQSHFLTPAFNYRRAHKLWTSLLIISFFATGDWDFRLPHSVVRLLEEQNDGNRPQPDSNGGRAGRRPSHLTRR